MKNMTLKQVFKKIIGEVDESNLVLNWNHIREASNGHYVCPDDPNASRFCIIGHVGRYRDKLSLKQERIWENLINKTRVSLTEPHTAKQVKSLFKTWLRTLESK